MPILPYLLEAVVDSLESALSAQKAGANRLELCCALELGGLTPSIGLIRCVCAQLSIPVQVLLRPRPGNFVYTAGEIEVMCADAALIVEAGASGIVTGALDTQGDLAKEQMLSIMATSPLPFTFHRAFDRARNPLKVAEQLIDLGVERILSSGQQPTALMGAELLGELQTKFGSEIVIMPGGGILPGNIVQIAEKTGCRELHFSALRTSEDSTIGHGINKSGNANPHFLPNPDKILGIRKAIEAYLP